MIDCTYDDEDYPYDYSEYKYDVEIITDCAGIKRRVFVLKPVDERYLYGLD
ncbi:MAG: hypothetical protein PWQ43_752 [Rikenellaceae bacterium]|nr:hypothetical protein [Rikenellaceae bacterium]